MSKIKNSIKHEQCQAISVRYCYSITLFLIYLIILQSCQKKIWDPNKQFENEVDKIIEQRRFSLFLEENIAKKNLKELNNKLKLSVRPGLEISNFYNFVGSNGLIVAKKTEGYNVWLTVQYHWKDIVAHHFGWDSQEYKHCSKTKPYIEVVANDIRIVSIAWF